MVLEMSKRKMKGLTEHVTLHIHSVGGRIDGAISASVRGSASASI